MTDTLISHLPVLLMGKFPIAAHLSVRLGIIYRVILVFRRMKAGLPPYNEPLAESRPLKGWKGECGKITGKRKDEP